MSRSKIEDELYESMRILSMTEQGFPMPLREIHFDWCCEHIKAMHRPARKPNPPRHWYHASIGKPARCIGCVPESPHEYSKGRDWRFDFAWPEIMLAVEVEGGLYTGGRHVTGKGYEKDLEKYNAATRGGWTLLRYSRRQVTSGEALNQIERAVRQAYVNLQEAS